MGAVQTKYADLLGTGPLVVISSVVGSWIVHQQNLALGHLADLDGGVFAVRIHFQQNAASELTFGEALWHHRTGGDIDDGIGPVQVVSEDRHEPVVQLLQHPKARDLEVSDGCKEVYYLHEEKVAENDWEILEEELDTCTCYCIGLLPGLHR